MYFDRRLWQLTRGLRGWIAGAILLFAIAYVVFQRQEVRA